LKASRDGLHFREKNVSGIRVFASLSRREERIIVVSARLPTILDAQRTLEEISQIVHRTKPKPNHNRTERFLVFS
jgi:hypothetical protein